MKKKKEKKVYNKEEQLELFKQKEEAHTSKIAIKKLEVEATNSKWKMFWFNFSQFVVWQKIRRGWNKFSCLHPVAADWIWKIFFFIVFSEGVTIWQYLVMTFLPYAFGSLNNGPWGWPGIELSFAGNQTFVIFGDAQGLGYFIAFEIAVFTAQCINFPLQRNITYKSKGNPWWQAMWYFIGWILISLLVNVAWGFINCFMLWWNVPDAVSGLLKTVVTGGLSMVVFFFIFMIIFPTERKEQNKENE